MPYSASRWSPHCGEAATGARRAPQQQPNPLSTNKCATCLRAALGDAEAGHDLVEHQDGALGLGDLAQTLEWTRE